MLVHGHNLLTPEHHRWWCYHCTVILIYYIIYKVAAASEGSLCLLVCPGPGVMLGWEEDQGNKKEGSWQDYRSWPGCRWFFSLISHPCGLFLVLLPHLKVAVCLQASSSTCELMLGFFLKVNRHTAAGAQESLCDIWQHWRDVQWCLGQEGILC